MYLCEEFGSWTEVFSKIFFPFMDAELGDKLHHGHFPCMNTNASIFPA